MSLTSGFRLGAYEIGVVLGAGAMLATSTTQARSNIWLFEGFPQPRGWLGRLWGGH